MARKIRPAALAIATLALAGAVSAIALSATRSQTAAASFPGLSPSDQQAIRGYQGWTRLTKKPPARLRSLGSAHRTGTHTIYASPARSQLVGRNGRQRFPYPVGTKILKTNTDGGAITLVAIMRKVARGSSTAGSWDYVEYQRSSGSASFSKFSGGEAACTGCHSYANGGQRGDPRTDSVFYALR
jgi:hypothetical protein